MEQIEGFEGPSDEEINQKLIVEADKMERKKKKIGLTNYRMVD